ncbi:MAG: hypothetical protein V1915_01275 [Candidatus Bathyarchaeota archaeon]
MAPLKLSTKLSLLFLVSVLTISVFPGFSFLKQSYPDIYQRVLPSEILEASFIIGGFIAMVVVFTIILYAANKVLRGVRRELNVS